MNLARTEINAIIFDLDGLIVDTEPLHQRAFNLLLARYGVAHAIDEAEYGRDYVGVPVRENCELVIGNYHLPLAVDRAFTERQAIYFDLIADPANLRVFSGALALIEKLVARDKPIALATGATRAEAQTILRGIGLTNHFRAIVTGSDVVNKKPAPDIYLRALEQLGMRAGECLALEDSASGVTAAKRAGLRVIAVPNRFTRHQDLAQADMRVSSLEEVSALVG